MDIVMVRHGRIDPSNRELLQGGNPHLAKDDWQNENLLRVGEQLMGIRFTAVYCGALHRNTETLQTLIISSDLPELWITDEFLDDPSTYHDGVIYPDIRPSFIAIMDSIPGYFQAMARKHGSEANILMVGGGAKIICMIALSRGLKFKNEEEVQSWITGEVTDEKVGLIGTGTIHSFSFSLDGCEVRKVCLQDMRCESKRRRK